MRKQKLQKQFTISCPDCGGSCTDVKIYKDHVELSGRGKTKGKISIPKEEFEELKKSICQGCI